MQSKLTATIAFAKSPILGKVKTRISLTHGPQIALNIYIELLSITAQIIAGTRYHVAYTGSNGPDTLESVFPSAESFFRQSGKDLGKRLHNAFSRFFKIGYDAVCAIGCDCPALSADDTSYAFRLLEENDVIIGPAHDGGYYLIACKENALAIFNAHGWGSPELLGETIALCRTHGLRYRLLKEKRDIDTYADYAAWKSK